jgi:hypothetical protein
MKSNKTVKSFWLIAIILSYVLVSYVGSTALGSGTRSQFPSALDPVRCEEIELASNGIQIGAT